MCRVYTIVHTLQTVQNVIFRFQTFILYCIKNLWTDMLICILNMNSHLQWAVVGMHLLNNLHLSFKWFHFYFEKFKRNRVARFPSFTKPLGSLRIGWILSSKVSEHQCLIANSETSVFVVLSVVGRICPFLWCWKLVSVHSPLTISRNNSCFYYFWSLFGSSIHKLEWTAFRRHDPFSLVIRVSIQQPFPSFLNM